ncbi:MAG TPA: SpoIID/LytB domain-containing protein [Synechococcales cyanobacterium M55_K2018_004]|nr:SpoIID/LytB domain-containing protein [Synechococcales cyanobacterium M55_K2018_004]
MRVAIEQDVSQVQVGGSTPTTLRDGNGRVLAQLPAQTAVVARAENGQVAVSDWRTGAVWLEPSGENGLVWIGGRWYRGRTLVVPTAGGLTAVNYVDLEEYLYSVVGSEVYPNWHPEALKAQAVAARTYALYQRQTGANAVFDVGDTVRWQVYNGVEEEASSTIAAVQATRGQVVTHQGRIINAVFHASAGGHTDNVENVWTNPLPYLRAVPAFDEAAPNAQWTVNVTADQLRAAIPGIGNILSLTPERVSPVGRVITLRATGDAGTKTITGAQLRSALNLRSTWFSVTPQPDAIASTRGVAGAPTSFQIVGRGFGHGLGMSQWGAQFMALQGRSYMDILRHYYTGTILSRIQVQ